jgi:hypothetical protein
MGGINYYTKWASDEQNAYKEKYGAPTKYPVKNITTTAISNQQKAFDDLWKTQQTDQSAENQARQSAYWASRANAENLAKQGQQSAQQQIAGYAQTSGLNDISRAAMNAQAQVSPVTQSQNAPQQGGSTAKGTAPVNPAGERAVQAAAANQTGSGQNQFTLPSTSGIKLGGS